jgi:hypothetical protein
MKRSSLILILVMAVALSSRSQSGGDNKTAEIKKGWSSHYRQQFLADCTDEARKGMSLDSAKFYCYCISEKIEAKYPDTSNIPIDEIQESEAWKKEIVACLNTLGKWTADDRIEFINNCIETATPGIGEKAAKSYCECMQYKVERKLPKREDIEKLTADLLKTPEWQKLMKSCLDY